MLKAAKLFVQCCSRRQTTRTSAFFVVVVCLTVLLWNREEVLVKEFTLGLNGDQRFLKRGKISKKSEILDKKQASDNEFQSLYSVFKPASRAVAWQSVTFDIHPRPASGLLAGRSAFRGEATSEYEVIVMDIRHIAEDVYRANFNPSFGGDYRITVLLTYVNDDNFIYNSHMASKKTNIQGSPFVISVENRPPPKGITRYCSRLESGTARGRWVRCGSLRNIEACGQWQVNVVYDFDGLHWFFWLPYTCQLHHYTNHEMKTCLAKNGWEKIIFTGDSHTRYRIYHWATRLYGKCIGCEKTHVATRFEHVPKMEWVFDARGTRWPATFPSIARPTEIYINPKTRRSLFSSPLPVSTHDGNLYLMNFGHWLLREVTFEKFMADKVRAYLEAIKLLNNSRSGNDIDPRTSRGTTGKPKRFLWVNTMSLRWREDEHVRNWTMTPSPSIIGHLNAFIDEPMKNEGIQIVDAFQVSNGRLNAAHDATHYAKVFPDAMCAGVVENAVTNVILNALCNDGEAW